MKPIVPLFIQLNPLFKPFLTFPKCTLESKLKRNPYHGPGIYHNWCAHTHPNIFPSPTVGTDVALWKNGVLFSWCHTNMGSCRTWTIIIAKFWPVWKNKGRVQNEKCHKKWKKLTIFLTPYQLLPYVQKNNFFHICQKYSISYFKDFPDNDL